MGKSAVTAGYTNAGSMAAKWAKTFLLLENRESMAKLGLSFSVMNPLNPLEQTHLCSLGKTFLCKLHSLDGAFPKPLSAFSD